MRAPGDPVHATLTRELNKALGHARSASDQIIRSLDGTAGASWSSELIATCRARLRTALADAAICRHLLKELDQIDELAAGKRPPGGA